MPDYTAVNERLKGPRRPISTLRPHTDYFFTPGPCQDPEYAEVRDATLGACRDFVEKLWQRYAPYCDPHFLSEARIQFHQRFWEMYLCVTMLKRRHVIERAGPVGPEYRVTFGGRKFWFEAIAATAGSGPNQVPQCRMGAGCSTPTEQVLMRFTAALKEKLEKYQSDLSSGIISENDGYVIALNSSKIPNAYEDSSPPYHVQAFLGIGRPTVVLSRETLQKTDSYYGYRGAIRNLAKSTISTKPFLESEYRGISAVIVARHNVAGYVHGGARWGCDFQVLHNPNATNPLPFDALSWCDYDYVCGDRLVHVTRNRRTVGGGRRLKRLRPEK